MNLRRSVSNFLADLKPFDDPQYKAYNPIAVESAWYSWWEKEGYFIPEFTSDAKV